MIENNLKILHLKVKNSILELDILLKTCISIAFFMTFLDFINFHDLSRPKSQFHDISMNNAN